MTKSVNAQDTTPGNRPEIQKLESVSSSHPVSVARADSREQLQSKIESAPEQAFNEAPVKGVAKAPWVKPAYNVINLGSEVTSYLYQD